MASVSTGFNGTVAEGFAELSQNGFTVAPADLMNGRTTLAVRSSPYSISIWDRRRIFNVTCPAASTGSVWCKLDGLVSIGLQVIVNGTVQSVPTIQDYYGAWTQIPFNLPAGSSTLQFLQVDGYTVYLDDWSMDTIFAASYTLVGGLTLNGNSNTKLEGIGPYTTVKVRFFN